MILGSTTYLIEVILRIHIILHAIATKKLRSWVCVDMVWDYWLMIGIGVGVWMGDL